MRGIAVALALIGCGGRTPPPADDLATLDPLPEVRCYAGVWRTDSGYEEVDRETPVILRRTVEPASSSIAEEWRFPAQLDDLVHELDVTGDRFTVVTSGDRTPRHGSGALTGTAWHWDAWTLESRTETYYWDFAYTRTATALDITGSSGRIGEEFPDEITIHLDAFDCAEWEQRRMLART